MVGSGKGRSITKLTKEKTRGSEKKCPNDKGQRAPNPSKFAPTLTRCPKQNYTNSHPLMEDTPSGGPTRGGGHEFG